MKLNTAYATDALDDVLTEIRPILTGGRPGSAVLRGFVKSQNGGTQAFVGLDVSDEDGPRELEFHLVPRRPADREVESNSAPTRTVSLDQLRSETFVKYAPIIDGVLNAGETLLLVGRPKVGKSRLVLQMALAVSRGESFLGYPVPEPRCVFLLDLENRPSGLQERFRRMSAPSEADRNVHVCAPHTLSDCEYNSSSTGIERLRETLLKLRPDVLIIDTWRLFVGGDENKPEIIVDALKRLAGLRRDLPLLSIIIVHHLRKEKFESKMRLRDDPYEWAQNVSGHHALVGHVDACAGIERESSPDGEEIAFGLIARSQAPACLILEEDEESLRFDVCSDGAIAIAAMTVTERKIWGEAQRLRKFTFNQLVIGAQTKNRKAVNSMLRKAQTYKLIERTGASGYRVMGGTDGTR